MDDDDPGLTVTITDQRGGLVTRWIAVAEVVDTDGDRVLCIETSEDLPNWDVLGFCAFATGVQINGGR